MQMICRVIASPDSFPGQCTGRGAGQRTPRTPRFAAGHPRMNLDEAVQFYCYRSLADATHKTYRSGLNRFLSFCYAMDIQSPFPVSETVLCYFVTALASQGTSPAMIRTYLTAVCHAQVVRGHPEPHQLSSLPRLRLVQNGVRRE